MSSIIPGYEYDIFISYRHKDNKYDGWVSEFVINLRKELDATFKEDISIYFDENPHDGLLETHHVDRSLEAKLKCLIFIPIISQTYCDPKSFAWQHEFVAFNRMAENDETGMEIKLMNGNVGSRVLPVKIHEIDAKDKSIVEQELGSPLRSIDFIYKFSGVNRPLRSNEEHPDENTYHTIYRNQINKVANAIKETISALSDRSQEVTERVSAPAPVRVEKAKALKPSSFGTGLKGSIHLSHPFFFETKRNVKSVILFSFGPAIFLSLITGVIVWNFKPAPNGEPDASIRSTILLPDDKPLEFIGHATLGIGRKSLTISKDGKKIAYIARVGETTKLMIRSLDNFKIDEIPNTEGAYNPVFSPDGKYLAFFQKNYVKQLVLQNYAITVLAEQPELWDASWGTDGELFFSSHEGRKLFKYFQKVELIQEVNKAYYLFKSIHRIPQTDYLLSSYGQVHILDLKTLQRTKLSIRGTNARYVNTGHIIFLKGSSLMAARFDIQKLKITSDEVVVLTGIRLEAAGDGQFDFSFDGKLVFVQGEDARKAHFVFYHYKRSRVESLNFPGQDYAEFALSPDGTRIAVSELHLTRNIYIYELKTGIIKRITNQGGCSGPVWHPDGETIFFNCEGDGYFKHVDRNEAPKKIIKGGRIVSFFQEGKMAVVLRPGPQEIFVRSMDDTTLVKIGNGGFPSVSPDGKYISYTSAESGELHVYLQTLHSPDQKWLVSTESGSEEPRWSNDGKKIFFRSGQKWMEVSVQYTLTVKLGTPKELFRGEFINVPGYSWDITRDNEKFLLLQSSSEKTALHISMIQGWFEELNRLVPVSDNDGY